MRLLFVTHNVPRTAGDAAGSFVLRLAVALRDAGHRVEIIAPGAPGLPGADAVEGIPITRVPYASASRMTLAYTGTMAEAVRASWSGRLALWGLLRALRRATVQHLDQARREGAPVTLVHAHWWFPAGLALWGVARRQGLPLVITMHGSDVRLAQGMRPAHPVMRAVLAQAAARTAVSRWLAEAAERIAPALPVSVAPMPVATTLFDVGAPEAPRGGILFAGRLNAQKGLADLLDAMARPPLQHATLEVVGDGPDAPALRARCESLGVADRIRWLGALPQPALALRYRLAAAVAIPSRAEGLGLVAVEAQLSGTPVVAYDDGGLRDVVRPDEGGTLVPPGDIGRLADGLGALLADPGAAARMGGLARAAMVERFSPAAVAERYLDIYRTALGSRSLAPNPGALA